MGAKKRQRTAQAHAEQYRFKLAEEAMNAMNALEARKFDRLVRSGVIREERSEENIESLLQPV